MTPGNHPTTEASWPQGKPTINPDRVALANLQPFGNDICATWHEGEGEASVPIHENALEELRALENQGRVILLSAPRAGHGKTHLLGRVAEKLQGEAVVASLPWETEEGMTWAGCGRGIVADLAYSGAKPNLLQQVCAGVHATLLKRLIQTGRIPSTDPSQALRVLSQDPMNLFSESGPAKVIGEWFRKHYDQLHATLTEVTYLEGRAEVADWLRAMFDYVEQPGAAALSALAAGMDAEGADQVERFLKLVATWRPVVLVADHMDGLYRDAEAGVSVARMALVLTSLPGVKVVLSMNQDLWDTTFGRQLPSALEDRLNARNVSLAGLNAEEARELLGLRMAKVGVGEMHRADFLNYLDLDRYFLGRAAGSVSTRGMLRHAAQAWRKWLRSASAETSVSGEPGPADGDALPMIPEAPAGWGAGAAMATSPFLPDVQEEQEEDISALARHLAEDQGGEVVSLAGPPGGANAGAPVPLPSAGAHDVPAAFLPVSAPAPPEGTAFEPKSAASGPTTPERGSPFAPAAESGEVSGGGGYVSGPQETSSLPEDREEGAPPPASNSYEGMSSPTEGTGNNFERLRQLLSKVRTGTETTVLPESSTKSPPKIRLAPSPPKEVAVRHRLMPSVGAATAVAADASPGVAARPSGGVTARFESLRQQILGRDQMLRVNWGMIGGVVRAAGKRFPVVNYDEVELPGLGGRLLARWRLQGVEMIFGLEDFADERYWKTVTSFVVGRVAELTAAASQTGQPSPQIKLMVFKGDMEAASLAGLLQQETIPAALRAHLDVVHLDSRSLASIYAMSQILTEVEEAGDGGEVHAALTTLANELDFFWKRLTRPLR